MNKWETAYLNAFTAFVNNFRINHFCEVMDTPYIFEDVYENQIIDKLSDLAEVVADTAIVTMRERMVKDLSQGGDWNE